MTTTQLPDERGRLGQTTMTVADLGYWLDHDRASIEFGSR